MEKKEEKIIYKSSLKIYHYAEVMKGYCENADGEAKFVDCLGEMCHDISRLALRILDVV